MCATTRAFTLFHSLLAIWLCPRVEADSTTFLKPRSTATGPEVALVWAQGALIPSHEYTPLLEAMQAASDLKLWVGQPSFVGNMPDPIHLHRELNATVTMMRSAGMNTTTIFYGAHSLATVFLQNFCADLSNGCAGQILVGGPLARTHYLPTFSYAVPTLSMGGSLDGMSRVTRLCEAYYHQIELAQLSTTFPVVVIEGMDHYQWASGAPSLAERHLDLRAEISLLDAHTKAATHVAAFLALRVAAREGVPAASRDRAMLSAAVRATAEFMRPLIDAYSVEGSRHFNAPRQPNGPEAKQCVKGLCPDKSQWAEVAQFLIAGSLPGGYEFYASNQFADLKSTSITGGAFYLPTISNDSASKTVSSTTFSACSWSPLDGPDMGAVYTSANEITTKLSSRQCIYIKGLGLTHTNFSVDDQQFCKMANMMAYTYALDHASAAAKARYLAHGQNYTFGDDVQKNGGPWFLASHIDYTDKGDAGVEISSPMMKTEIDYWKRHFGPTPRPRSVPDPGCFHYCKLLSPARAMEWIYVDGLRRHYTLGATPSTSTRVD